LYQREKSLSLPDSSVNSEKENPTGNRVRKSSSPDSITERKTKIICKGPSQWSNESKEVDSEHVHDQISLVMQVQDISSSAKEYPAVMSDEVTKDFTNREGKGELLTTNTQNELIETTSHIPNENLPTGSSELQFQTNIPLQNLHSEEPLTSTDFIPIENIPNKSLEPQRTTNISLEDTSRKELAEDSMPIDNTRNQDPGHPENTAAWSDLGVENNIGKEERDSVVTGTSPVAIQIPTIQVSTAEDSGYRRPQNSLSLDSAIPVRGKQHSLQPNDDEHLDQQSASHQILRRALWDLINSNFPGLDEAESQWTGPSAESLDTLWALVKLKFPGLDEKKFHQIELHPGSTDALWDLVKSLFPGLEEEECHLGKGYSGNVYRVHLLSLSLLIARSVRLKLKQVVVLMCRTRR
jgi:hypothetical protein